jgi:hypothetical protein
MKYLYTLWKINGKTMMSESELAKSCLYLLKDLFKLPDMTKYREY